MIRLVVEKDPLDGGVKENTDEGGAGGGRERTLRRNDGCLDESGTSGWAEESSSSSKR